NQFRASLQRIHDVVALVLLGALVPSAISATIGVTSLLASSALPGSQGVSTWRVWLLGEIVGYLLFASGSLILASTPVDRIRLPAVAETLGVAALLGVGSAAVLLDHSTLAYMIFVLLLLLALRYRQRGAVAGGIVVSVV